MLFCCHTSDNNVPTIPVNPISPNAFSIKRLLSYQTWKQVLTSITPLGWVATTGWLVAVFLLGWIVGARDCFR